MKNFFKILFPALLLLLSACQREMELTEAGRMAEGPVSVAVTIDPETRTTVSESTGAISFSCGDAIKIYNGTGTYTGITQDASTAAQFSMQKGFSASGSGFAGFPADLASGITSSGVSFTLPDTYGFARVGGEEANKADVPCPMVGNYAGGGISLKPACALVRFYLTGIKAGTIVFTFPTNVTGSTTAIATPTGTNDGITSLSNGGKTITVTDVPDAPKGRYVYITLPVPTGTKPQNIKVINIPADDSMTLMAAVPGSSTSLARAAGHKVMNISFISPEAVDLGIGVKWASFNVGALSETEYGDYFAWGETAPKTSYSWSNYKWGTIDDLTKYNEKPYVLEPSDDAATVNWGGKWRMPTYEDFQSLHNKTDKELVSNYNGTGVKGYKFMNKSDHSKYIFLPLAGRMDGSSVGSAGTAGSYWSSSLSVACFAQYYYLYSTSTSSGYTYRYYGYSVRPVLQEEVPLASLKLSSESVTLVTGATRTLSARAIDACGNRIPGAHVYWAVVSGESATVNADGFVTAGTQPGPTVLRATVSYGGVTKTADCTVIVQAEGLEMVDMGLSVKWANMNVGAASVTGEGGYFGWGETETKPFNTPYHWTRYQWCEGALSTLTKYCNSSDYGYYGFTDTKTVLELSDDAARVYMGGDWRMPTKAEFEELLALQNDWVTNYNGSGVAGRLFTANNGKTLFLPAEGYMDGALNSNNSYGYYWSSTLNTDNANRAWNVYLSTGASGYGSHTSYEFRCYGMQVRAVSK